MSPKSGSDLIPSPSVVSILNVSPFIKTEISATMSLLAQVTFKFPLLIIKLLSTIREPVPQMVRLEPDLNLISAPSKSFSFSSVSLSIIVEISSNIN